VSTAQSELLARTSPTIYDVLIALFGGLAGILATTSRQKGNVIPGVAIATALMPPMCTAGYGLATGQFDFFFGAIYLFTINAVFIGISAVAMSQVLKFPLRTIVDPSRRKRINSIISLVITITIVPSIYFGYKLVQKERFIERANRFTRSIGSLENSYLMRQEVNAEKSNVTLVYGGNMLTSDQKLYIRQLALQHSIDSNSLIIKQGFSINDIQENNEDFLTNEVSRLNLRLRSQQDSIRVVNELGKQLFGELNSLYPNIVSTSLSKSWMYSDTNRNATQVTIVYIMTVDKGLSLKEKEQIKDWLQKR